MMFEPLFKKNVINKKTNIIYYVCSSTCVDKESNYTNIVEICNQPEINNTLFKRKYTQSDCISFFKWAEEGWVNKTHFVFFVTNIDNEIVACLDIKSNNLDKAEVGYWCSNKHNGLTAEALKIVIDWAKQNNFKLLFAKPITNKSKILLKNVGFDDDFYKII